MNRRTFLLGSSAMVAATALPTDPTKVVAAAKSVPSGGHVGLIGGEHVRVIYDPSHGVREAIVSLARRGKMLAAMELMERPTVFDPNRKVAIEGAEPHDDALRRSA